MVIDIFAHHISERVIEFLEKRPGQIRYHGAGGRIYPAPLQNADPDVRLGLMDKYGVDIQAISQTTPILFGLSPEDAADVCRISNDDNYNLCKAYPDRFVNICIISLLDMQSAMTELDRSIDELDCRGVTISTNQNGKGLDSPDYFPFYEKVVEKDLPVFLHPTHWKSYPLVDMETAWGMMLVLGWPFDTSQAVWRLIFGGVLDRFPPLKIVMHHLGAMLPYFVCRIEEYANRALKDKLPRNISEYWKNLYGDTALDGNMPAYHCGYAFFGPDRMLYGSDYPFGTSAGEDYIRENLEVVKEMDIPVEAMEKILSGNAKILLKID
jgi:aminocarboxymuconate-semialdehyde decarboxylase